MLHPNIFTSLRGIGAKDLLSFLSWFKNNDLLFGSRRIKTKGTISSLYLELAYPRRIASRKISGKPTKKFSILFTSIK
jgi:hypothetical protein